VIVSVKEAGKLWCPHVRAKMDDEVASYNDTDAVRVGTCIASECMAWRWVSYGGDVESMAEPIKSRGGYCGLAGAP